MRDHRADLAHQDGVVIGNVEDKASLSNPISRLLVGRFDRTLLRLLATAAPTSVHEVGCGEGRLTTMIAARYQVPVLGTEFSTVLVEQLGASDLPERVTIRERSIYDLDAREDHADVVVCCEVLEHLDHPAEALLALRRLGARQYVLSVPREPLWRVLNVVRGKYLADLGNTPGHLNHWSRRGFLAQLASAGFRCQEVASPLPWTMVRGTFDAAR